MPLDGLGTLVQQAFTELRVTQAASQTLVGKLPPDLLTLVLGELLDVRDTHTARQVCSQFRSADSDAWGLRMRRLGLPPGAARLDYGVKL